MSVPAGSGPGGRGHTHWSSFGEHLAVARSAQWWFSSLLACVGVLGCYGHLGFCPTPTMLAVTWEPWAPDIYLPSPPGQSMQGPPSGPLRTSGQPFPSCALVLQGQWLRTWQLQKVFWSLCVVGAAVWCAHLWHPVCVTVPAWPCSWSLGHYLYLSICVPGGLFLVLNIH